MEDRRAERPPTPEATAGPAAGPAGHRRRGIKRLAVVLSIVVFFTLGAPVWYYMTSLNRPHLPHEAMRSAGVSQPALPALVRLWMCTDKPKAAGMATGAGHHVDLLLEALQLQGLDLLHTQALQVSATWVTQTGCQPADPLKLLMGKTPKPLVGSVSSPSRGCPDVMKYLGREVATGDDAVESALSVALRVSGYVSQEGVYDVFLMALTSEGLADQTAVVGQGRLAWVLGPMWRSLPEASGGLGFAREMAKTAATVCLSLWNGHGRLTSKPGSFPLVDTQGLSLLLSLCNADPRSGSCGWDAEWLDSAALQPVTRALAPLGRIEVNSQVLQHTRARVQGRWSKEQEAYLLEPHQLPFLVDSEWNLEPDRAVLAGGYHSMVPGMDEASRPPGSALHFVVYVPPPEQRPLRILTAEAGEGSESRSTFSISSWGGVTLLDPAQGCCREALRPDRHSTSESAQPPGRCISHLQLEADDLVEIARAVVTQLRASFGIGSTSQLDLPSENAAAVSTLPAQEAGFAAWEVDLLIKRQVELNVRSVASTLESLSQLVASLPNLDIPDEVATLVERALVLLAGVNRAAAAGNYSQSAEASRAARAAADAAFFHPSIMAEHSYPAAHLVAMYMPYFLPISIPILRVVYKEVARRCRPPAGPSLSVAAVKKFQ